MSDLNQTEIDPTDGPGLSTDEAPLEDTSGVDTYFDEYLSQPLEPTVLDEEDIVDELKIIPNEPIGTTEGIDFISTVVIPMSTAEDYQTYLNIQLNFGKVEEGLSQQEYAQMYYDRMIEVQKQFPGLILARSAAAVTKQFNTMNTFFRETLEGSDYKESYGDIKNAFLRQKKKLGGREVSGATAITLMQSKYRGLVKANLMNSGISVRVKGLSMYEHDEVHRIVASEGYQFGRELGAVFYLYSDFLIKESIMKLIFKNIVQTSLENGDDYETFISNVSIHDYDTLLWAFIHAANPEGVEGIIACTNPSCRNITRKDFHVQNLAYTDWNRVGKAAINMWSDNPGMWNTLQVSQYKNTLAGCNDDASIIRVEIPDTDPIKIYLEVPTMKKYFEFAESFYRSAIKDLKTEKPTEDDVKNYYEMTYYRALTPWIKRIEILDAETGEVDSYIPEGLPMNEYAEIMDIIQAASISIHKEIHKFMARSKMTFIGHPDIVCPVCKTPSSYATNGLIPYDVQSIFFIAATRSCLVKNLRNPTTLNGVANTSGNTDN